MTILINWRIKIIKIQMKEISNLITNCQIKTMGIKILIEDINDIKT